MIESVPPLPPSGWRFNTLRNEGERDLIEKWLGSDVPIGERKAVREYEPQFKWLRGAHEGIGEVRIHPRGKEYRFLGCLGPEPDQFTLLIGSTKKSNKEWIPANARDSAVGWMRFLATHPENVNAVNLGPTITQG
jgi:hypothetical protein